MYEKSTDINIVLTDTGPEAYKDAPICVQVVGYRYTDEALMHTAALVDSILKGEIQDHSLD